MTGNKWMDALLVAAAIATGVLIYCLVIMLDQCKAKGGVLVKGVVGYQCVTKAKDK